MTELSEIRKVTSERIVSKIAEGLHHTKISSSAPIGMFDSGVGGLSVLKEIINILPHENIIYFADTARVPYGGRSQQEIININRELIGFFRDQGVKMVILACGTSSSIAYPVIKDEYKFPIVGLVGPGSKAAVIASKNHKIGLIATVGTVESQAIQKEIKAINPNAEVFAQACPLFVPLIEGGFGSSEEIKRAAREYLKPLIEAQVDTLILGCTHYPHIKGIIQEIMGSEVTLIDPALETAKEADEILKKKGLMADKSSQANYTYMVSGSVPQFKDLGSKLLEKPIISAKKITLIAKQRPIE